MSKNSVRPATRPQSDSRQAAADLINEAFKKPDIAGICHAIPDLPPVFTIFLTLRRILGLRGRAFTGHLQAIQ